VFDHELNGTGICTGFAGVRIAEGEPRFLASLGMTLFLGKLTPFCGS
jgi:hypothetical protein